jgi:hypothetical protein
MSRLVDLGRPGAALRAGCSALLVAGLLVLAPAARATTLSLYVTFSPTGTITVTLPDGTPVGSTSGAPTVIPAGYYTLFLSGPGACTQLPLFELKGPGEDIFSDMTAGEVDYTSQNAYFKPNSTFIWRNYAAPGVVHTFVTSGDVQGTQPTPLSPAGAGMSSTVTSDDIVGSLVGPFRGTLTATVSATGRLSLVQKGKSLAGLKAGRYTIVVRDASTSSGVFLQKAKGSPVAVTTTQFVGKRSTSVRLTAGRWQVLTRPGKPAYSISVS